MDELGIYLRLQARARRRALPAASRRHIFLSDEPLVVVGYHLAGEPGAPVGLRYGTSPDRWRTVVVAEPRDRQQRFAALRQFADDLADHLAGYTGREQVPRLDRKGLITGYDSVCPDAPQLLVANGPTASWLCDTLGRSLRYLRTDGDFPVDPALPRAGADLSFLASRRVLPGSALVLAATDLLTTHWTTGQLPAEDADLHAALGWVDPPVDSDGPAAAAAGEQLPASGPVPDPDWDAEFLVPAVQEYHRATVPGTAADPDPGGVGKLLCGHLDEALSPTWQAIWRTRQLVALLPEAGHVPVRWESDRRAWSHHLDRVEAGTAHFSRRLDQLRSFRFLAELEARTAALERQMASDDPRVMARYVAAGEALAGTVVGRDIERRETSAKGTAVLRPLLRVRPDLPFDRPVGTDLWLSNRPGVQVRLAAVDPTGVLDCVVVKGMGRKPAQADSVLPALAESVVLAPFGKQDVFPDNLPDELPWTHRPAGESQAVDGPDGDPDIVDELDGDLVGPEPLGADGSDR